MGDETFIFPKGSGQLLAEYQLSNLEMLELFRFNSRASLLKAKSPMKRMLNFFVFIVVGSLIVPIAMIFQLDKFSFLVGFLVMFTISCVVWLIALSKQKAVVSETLQATNAGLPISVLLFENGIAWANSRLFVINSFDAIERVVSYKAGLLLQHRVSATYVPAEFLEREVQGQKITDLLKDRIAAVRWSSGILNTEQ
jgi:hypothetical protein